MARSLNRVQLIGNLTRDPELRYTPTGAAVCSFGLATNRSWTTDTGEKKEEVEFHRLVAWNKLAELCSQLLAKGRKVFVEGRLAYRKYNKQDGTEQQVTEIVIDDMLVLDSRKGEGVPSQGEEAVTQKARQEVQKEEQVGQSEEVHSTGSVNLQQAESNQTMSSEEIADDIPF